LTRAPLGKQAERLSTKSPNVGGFEYAISFGEELEDRAFDENDRGKCAAAILSELPQRDG